MSNKIQLNVAPNTTSSRPMRIFEVLHPEYLATRILSTGEEQRGLFIRASSGWHIFIGDGAATPVPVPVECFVHSVTPVTINSINVTEIGPA